MFQLTQEVQDQITLHAKWQNSFCAGQVYPEPVNPWPALLEEMCKAVEDVELGWGALDEMCIDYIEQFINDNEFYDHIRHRYQVGAIDAQTVVEQLKPFCVLRNFY